MTRRTPLLVTVLAAVTLLLIGSATLVWAMPAQGEDSPTSATVDTPQDNNVVTGHARTDEDPPRPVQNARIVARRPATGAEVSTTTDAEGAYTLELPVGVATWNIRAEKTDTTIPPEAEAPSISRPVVFGPRPSTKTGIDFTFHVPSTEEGAHIVGRVLVSATVPFVPTFPVTVTDVSIQIPPKVTSGQINPTTGRFDLTVSEGRHQVAIFPQDFLNYLPPVIPPFKVETGETHDLGDLYLIPLHGSATIRGQVLTTEDQPVAGVQVVAMKLGNILTGGGLQVPEIKRAQTSPTGDFALPVTGGTWWVAVSLGQGDPYMPYRLQWQTIVNVEDGGTVDDVILRVAAADAWIRGTLINAATGQPADDACGVVAAYKQGQAGTYSFRRFTGSTFDLPVTAGTYRLSVIPSPDLEDLDGSIPYPPSCEPGKYLVTTVPQVEVNGPGVTSIQVQLAVRTGATIRGQLWNLTEKQSVTGVGGVMIGWQPAASGTGQGNWAAARIDPATGVGELQVTQGDWLVSYHVQAGSGYRAFPGVISVTVPSDVTTVDVHLPVVQPKQAVSGQVLDPDGNGVRGVIVTATGIGWQGLRGALIGPNQTPVGLSRDMAAVTNKDGTFTLNLSYGVYRLSVLGPPELLKGQGDQPWISPQPEIIKLLPNQPAPTPVLRFRTGDATIHGHLSLATGSAQSGKGTEVELPAMVWAATAGGPSRITGHTKVLVPMSGTGEGDYSLPAIQGQRWVVQAVYEVGSSLWMTRAVVDVDSADVRLDLTLTPRDLLPAGVAQILDPDEPFYVELADGASLYIPAGALTVTGQVASAKGATAARPDAAPRIDLPTLISLQSSLIKTLGISVPVPCCSNVGVPLSPAYEIGAQLLQSAPQAGAQGVGAMPQLVPLAAPADIELNVPMVLRIPYDASALAAEGISEEDIRVWYMPTDTADTREPVEDYVIDAEHDEVVIFAEGFGTYTLAAERTTWSVYLPFTLR